MRFTRAGTAFVAVLLALVFASFLFSDIFIEAIAGVLFVVILAEAIWNVVAGRSPGKLVQLVPEQSDQGFGKVVLYPGDESVRKVRLVKKMGGRTELGSTVNFQNIAPSSVSGKSITMLEFRFSTRYAGEYIGRRVNLRVSGPFGLFTSETSIPFDQEYVVYPRTLQVVMATLRLLGRGELGETPIDMPGIGTEFYEMRQYHPSDDYRDVNWKATARGGEMVVVEHMREVGAGYLLVLDSRAAGFADRDSLASAFLALANTLASSGVGFEVMAHDGERVTLASSGDSPRRSLELALKAALEQSGVEVGRELLELAQTRRRFNIEYEKETVLSTLLWLRKLQGTEVVENASPWPNILERVGGGSTKNVVWVSGLFGDVAPLMELAWRARHLHDLEFAVADPCLPDESTGSMKSEPGFQESNRLALSSAGVRLYYGKPLVIAQRILSSGSP